MEAIHNRQQDVVHTENSFRSGFVQLFGVPFGGATMRGTRTSQIQMRAEGFFDSSIEGCYESVISKQ